MDDLETFNQIIEAAGLSDLMDDIKPLEIKDIYRCISGLNEAAMYMTEFLIQRHESYNSDMPDDERPSLTPQMAECVVTLLATANTFNAAIGEHARD